MTSSQFVNSFLFFSLAFLEAVSTSFLAFFSPYLTPHLLGLLNQIKDTETSETYELRKVYA